MAGFLSSQVTTWAEAARDSGRAVRVTIRCARFDQPTEAYNEARRIIKAFANVRSAWRKRVEAQTYVKDAKTGKKIAVGTMPMRTHLEDIVCKIEDNRPEAFVVVFLPAKEQFDLYEVEMEGGETPQGLIKSIDELRTEAAVARRQVNLAPKSESKPPVPIPQTAAALDVEPTAPIPQHVKPKPQIAAGKSAEQQAQDNAALLAKPIDEFEDWEPEAKT